MKSNEKIKTLAKAYIKYGVFPDKYFEDALHVGVCSFYNISYLVSCLVSWNFEHMVKVKTRRLVNLINVLMDYKEIGIISPQEL